MNTHICYTGFDIETRPRLDLVERFTKPFPDFDETSVKYGNIKDPEKIAQKIADCRAAHEAERVAYWKSANDRASLNPFTAEIVVIGLIDENARLSFLEGDEPAILAAFWETFALAGDAARKFVFWSGCGSSSKMFDLDFLVTRSRIRGVRIPPGVRSGRYYGARLVDLASEFLLYQNEAYLSLTRAADVFGLYAPKVDAEGANEVFPKRDDDPVTGENFWQWYDGAATETTSKVEQRIFALKYLRNDLLHLFHLAPRIL